MLFDKWNHLAWKMLNSPIEQWKVLPTFLIGEYLFMALALLALWHAYCQPGRLHLLVWLSALVTGSANDIFFMYLPLVDNFWQAQATIMLTPRLPLYIPAVYTVFLYTATVTAWRLGLPRAAEACLAGLLAEAFYCVYDIVGAKFLWWTWHDTDPPIRERLLNVPVGSSLWVVTFGASFALLLRLCRLERGWIAPAVLLFAALASTPLMMLQMSALQLLSAEVQGEPTQRSLLLALTLYGIVVLAQLPCRSTLRHPAGHLVRRSADRWLNGALGAYYGVMCMLLLLGRPEQHQSRGVHQALGPCYVEQRDFSGQVRHEFLCANDFDEDWHFRCTERPVVGARHDWYTVCGQRHSNFTLWMAVVLVLSAAGFSLFTAILRFRMIPTAKGRSIKKDK